LLRESRARYLRRTPTLPRVLLVEDDVLARRAALRALAGQAELTVVASGEEALARFRPAAFDLVVAQQRMVAMTGLELLEQIRVRDPRVRRVLLAAADLPGMLGYLASGLIDLRLTEVRELGASLPALIVPKPS
ncbi:MAG: response regulator, partial [Polyangiales bacterium]